MIVEPGSFTFQLPTRIRFGAGTRRTTGEVAAGFGDRSALVVGRAVAGGEGVRDIESAMAGARVTVAARHVVQGEPDLEGVLALIDALRAAGVDSVVAVGGGSVLDTAKAAALLPTSEALDRFLAGDRVARSVLPVIALPTTAGTGAEVSQGAIVLDRATGRKRGIRGPGVAPTDAIVDPELVLGAPPSVIATAGFDAIAHAVETSASRAGSALTLRLAAIALPGLLQAVPVAYANPNDLAAASTAAYASMLMGINLANSSTCLPHRLQYPVGGLTGTSHGAGVAALFPAWLERTVAVAPAALARLARAMGAAGDEAGDQEAAATLAALVLEVLERTHMRSSLGSLGVRREDVPELVARVEGSVGNDPGPSGPDDLRDLYLASL